MYKVHSNCLLNFIDDYVILNTPKLNGTQCVDVASKFSRVFENEIMDSTVIPLCPKQNVRKYSKGMWQIYGCKRTSDERAEMTLALRDKLNVWSCGVHFSTFQEFTDRYHSMVNKPEKIRLPKYVPRKEIVLDEGS